jgi:hypothetical protein
LWLGDMIFNKVIKVVCMTSMQRLGLRFPIFKKKHSRGGSGWTAGTTFLHIHRKTLLGQLCHVVRDNNICCRDLLSWKPVTNSVFLCIVFKIIYIWRLFYHRWHNNILYMFCTSCDARLYYFVWLQRTASLQILNCLFLSM